MAEPRVRACNPPRMAVLVDGREVPLAPGSPGGGRIDVIHEHPGPTGDPQVAVTSGSPSSYSPITPRVPDTSSPLACVTVSARATVVEQHDITLYGPHPLIPLEDDWVSPTINRAAAVDVGFAPPPPAPWPAVDALPDIAPTVTVPPATAPLPPPIPGGWLSRVLDRMGAV